MDYEAIDKIAQKLEPIAEVYNFEDWLKDYRNATTNIDYLRDGIRHREYYKVEIACLEILDEYPRNSVIFNHLTKAFIAERNYKNAINMIIRREDWLMEKPYKILSECERKGIIKRNYTMTMKEWINDMRCIERDKNIILDKIDAEHRR